MWRCSDMFPPFSCRNRRINKQPPIFSYIFWGKKAQPIRTRKKPTDFQPSRGRGEGPPFLGLASLGLHGYFWLRKIPRIAHIKRSILLTAVNPMGPPAAENPWPISMFWWNFRSTLVWPYDTVWVREFHLLKPWSDRGFSAYMVSLLDIAWYYPLAQWCSSVICCIFLWQFSFSFTGSFRQFGMCDTKVLSWWSCQSTHLTGQGSTRGRTNHRHSYHTLKSDVVYCTRKIFQHAT